MAAVPKDYKQEATLSPSGRGGDDQSQPVFVTACDQPSKELRSLAPLQTLTSGRKMLLQGGAIQAHICVVSKEEDVDAVMQAFRRADAFKTVASWSFAYRIVADAGLTHFLEGSEDGFDEGCGEKILGVLRRQSLHGLLLMVSRWQEYSELAVTAGIDLFGLPYFGFVVERCKDLLANITKVLSTAKEDPARAGIGQGREQGSAGLLPSFPRLPEPPERPRFGHGHFMTDKYMQRSQSLPTIFAAAERANSQNESESRRSPQAEKARVPHWSECGELGELPETRLPPQGIIRKDIREAGKQACQQKRLECVLLHQSHVQLLNRRCATLPATAVPKKPPARGRRPRIDDRS
eukprot:gnl/TRDRNA2_/TRDRNA2_186688_c0_seq1.p1 gnl/TRDRNA2_/TRDRNA2_186688_c0~~gnl/TRDRNA2_/TRDRNA2_186688_c0_seq1.p1  ORF type:complete len:350 (-),score=60.92 gnl/TRDRNA2_/TRDRNA2_186688_c0_seq1:197-1246(-)